METKKRTTRKMNLLTAVEQVVELSKGSHLNDEFYKKAARPLKHLANKLELSKEQCVMMALFIDNSTNSNIRISDFSRYLDCSTTRVIRFLTVKLDKHAIAYNEKKRRKAAEATEQAN